MLNKFMKTLFFCIFRNKLCSLTLLGTGKGRDVRANLVTYTENKGRANLVTYTENKVRANLVTNTENKVRTVEIFVLFSARE